MLPDEVGEPAEADRGEEAGGVCEVGEGNGEGIEAVVDAFGAVQELDHEDGRDFEVGDDEAEVEVDEAKEDREDQDDQDEEPCCAVPASWVLGGAAELEDQDDDQEGEKVAWAGEEGDDAVEDDQEEPPDHHEEPLPPGGC